MTTTATERDTIVATIRQGLEQLHEPGDVIEIRAIGVGRVNTVAGYFKTPDVAADACYTLSYQREAIAVYHVLNSFDSCLWARIADRLQDNPKYTTTNENITRRRKLFLDFDPQPAAGISASDSENAQARRLAGDIEEILRQRGWPYPLTQDSGNGFYLLYTIDLPNDKETDSLLERFYIGLAELTKDCVGTIKIDAAVRNAGRIARVPGTMNRKGDDVPERPHRQSVLYPPDSECPVSVVPVELIQEVASLAPAKPTTPNRSHRSNGSSVFDLPGFLGECGITYKTKRIKDNTATAYLITCVFDENHGKDGETAIIQPDNGPITYFCMHNSCQGRVWDDFRQAVGKPKTERFRTYDDDAPAFGPSSNGSRTTDDTSSNGCNFERPRFTQLIDSAALLSMDLKPRFLVNGILVANQPCVIGGPSKVLKTSIAVDLAVALASGGLFLGKFHTQQQRVAIWSGESVATLRDSAIRVCKDKVDLAELPIQWCFDLPKIGRMDHVAELERVIQENELQVIFIDPLYLSLLDAKSSASASNVYAMGSLLHPVAELGQRTNTTIVVLHHFKRTGQKDEQEPASLEMLSQAGIVEWARQWVLLDRRSPYQADGRHELWLRAGGSMGHCGLWAVNVDEGMLDPTTMDGRYWDVDVQSVIDAKAEAKREAEQRKARALEERDDDDRRRLLDAMVKLREPETKRVLRELTGLSNDRVGKSLTCLLGEGRIEITRVRKHRKDEDAYRLLS